MVVIQEIIAELEELRGDFQENTNYCNQLFNKLIDESKINIDVFYSARAFTSIINSIVNNKTKYANYIIDNQIELLNFLNSFDDNYLSNIYYLLSQKMRTEEDILFTLSEDIFDLINFLKDFLLGLEELEQNKNSNILHKQLEDMLKEFEEKYKGGFENE